MADFDYGNARLRSRMAEMVPGKMLYILSQSTSLQTLLAGLTKTPYRKSVERAHTHMNGIALLESVLSEEVYATVQQLLSYYEGSALVQIKILLSYEDLQNLKIILRGILKGAPKDYINDALLQWGCTPPAFLRNIAASNSMDEAVAHLAILGHDASRVLSTLISDKIVSAADIDYALEKWFFSDVLVEQAKQAPPLLLSYFRLRADIYNLLAICTQYLYSDFFQGQDITKYLLEQGNIPIKTLNQSAICSNLEQAIIALHWTPYFKPLRLLMDNETAITLAKIDNRLQALLMDWVMQQPYRDPLGIGVPIGYIHKKKREIECLRYIARSIQLGLQPECIIENMGIPA